MCIGMGRGAEDVMVAGDAPPDRSMIDIVSGPQV